MPAPPSPHYRYVAHVPVPQADAKLKSKLRPWENRDPSTDMKQVLENWTLRKKFRNAQKSASLSEATHSTPVPEVSAWL